MVLAHLTMRLSYSSHVGVYLLESVEFTCYMLVVKAASSRLSICKLVYRFPSLSMWEDETQDSGESFDTGFQEWLLSHANRQ